MKIKIVVLVVAHCLSVSSVLAGKIDICHYPLGNPENVQTISINENAWSAHEAHGDAKNACSGVSSSSSSSSSGEQITVCDGRTGETGRLIDVSATGRVSSTAVECD